MSDFKHVSSRLGDVKSETRSIAKEIYDAAKAAGHEIWFMWGMGTSSEHSTGLALDLMVRTRAAGDWIRNYIWTNRKRLRLRHVIWWQRITSTVVQPGVVRVMGDRGNPTANHMDHIHTWHFAGKYQPPVQPTKSIAQLAAEVLRGDWGNGAERVDRLTKAGYDPKAVQTEVNRRLSTPTSTPNTPKPEHPILRRNDKGPATEWNRRLQRWFREVFPAYRNSVSVRRGVLIVIDGFFGGQTEAWVKEFQKRVGIKQDGIVGPNTVSQMRRHGYKF